MRVHYHLFCPPVLNPIPPGEGSSWGSHFLTILLALARDGILFTVQEKALTKVLPSVLFTQQSGFLFPNEGGWMEKARFLQGSILLIFPFHNLEKIIAFVISTCALWRRSPLRRTTRNLRALIALAKTSYNGRWWRILENLGRAA